MSSLFYFLGNKTHFGTTKDLYYKHDQDILKTCQTVEKVTDTPLTPKTNQNDGFKDKHE